MGEVSGRSKERHRVVVARGNWVNEEKKKGQKGGRTAGLVGNTQPDMKMKEKKHHRVGGLGGGEEKSTYYTRITSTAVKNQKRGTGRESFLQDAEGLENKETWCRNRFWTTPNKSITRKKTAREKALETDIKHLKRIPRGKGRPWGNQENSLVIRCTRIIITNTRKEHRQERKGIEG